MARVGVIVLVLHRLNTFLLLVSAEHIVYPVVIKSRSGASEVVLRVSEEITLNLEKGTILGDSFFFTETVNGEVQHELMDVEELKESLYQSPEHMASFTLTESGDSLLVTGTINSTHGIEPLETAGDGGSRKAHRLFLIPQPDSYDSLLGDTFEGIDIVPEERDGVDEELPDVVRPELYVVTDKSFRTYFKGSRRSQAQYVIRLLNCVNLIYVKMVNPKIRLQLVGIRSLDASEEREFVVEQAGYVDSRTTIVQFGNYTNRSRFPRHADMFLLLVGRTIADFSNKKKPNPLQLGIASTASVCWRGMNVALVEDPPGTYGGYLVAAHELGHVLGAVHDGSPPTRVVRGHQGASTCKKGGGFVMDTFIPEKSSQMFSKCSVDQIRFVLKYRGRDCWETKSDYDFFNVTKLLAQTVPADKFCQARYGPLHHSGSLSDCVITCKLKPDSATPNKYPTQKFPAPFGFHCDSRPNTGCFFGKCLPRNQWLNHYKKMKPAV